MKKIDLHIHTISTNSDCDFEFSIEQLKNYIEKREIDGIAITNHNHFDLEQYQLISDSLTIVTFPGIEIDLGKGHILLISDVNEFEDFNEKCNTLSNTISNGNGSISFQELQEVFQDLSRYILIPHYRKNPEIDDETLRQLRPYISAGEVPSVKKFIYCQKDSDSIVPVMFSDIRCSNTISEFPPRQTYIDAGDVSFGALRTCLRDKNKVFLSEKDGHKFFDALDTGLRLSTGLNVILGERSSGKTYTLNRLFSSHENVKYIEQFSLLVRDEQTDVKNFNEKISKKNSIFTEEYLKEFKVVVDSMVNVDLERNEQFVEDYISSLLKNAEESEKYDAFSKAKLFSETTFLSDELVTLKSLIKAVETLIENKEYREIIDKYLSLLNLKKLAVNLMEISKGETENNKKKNYANELINNIRSELTIRSATPSIQEIDLYQIAKERKIAEKFVEIVTNIRHPEEIHREEIQGFKIIAKKRNFSGAQELKNQSGKKISFSDPYKWYDDPYKFLISLRNAGALGEADFYKYFVKIQYEILNRHDTEVSGGERSEFQLLQAIADAQQFDMLLIDEPESSFDNIFLMEEVNGLIKSISKSIPVVIVTHNNTVGASIKPDYVIYTRKTVNNRDVQYDFYSGFPSDKVLVSPDGKEINNFEVMMNCLEAGPIAYSERGSTYENLKN